MLQKYIWIPNCCPDAMKKMGIDLAIRIAINVRENLHRNKHGHPSPVNAI
jgi:hypothetical protein